MKALLTKQEKEELLERYERSGKTHAQFAGENGLNAGTFKKWVYERRHQEKTSREVKFVEIKTTAESAAKEIRIRKAGMEVEVPAGLDPVQMRNILTVLAAI